MRFFRKITKTVPQPVLAPVDPSISQGWILLTEEQRIALTPPGPLPLEILPMEAEVEDNTRGQIIPFKIHGKKSTGHDAREIHPRTASGNGGYPIV